MFDTSHPRAPLPAVSRQEQRIRTALVKYAAMLVDDGLLPGDAELIGQCLWPILHGVLSLRLGRQIDDEIFDCVLLETVQPFMAGYSPIFRECQRDKAAAQLRKPMTDITPVLC